MLEWDAESHWTLMTTSFDRTYDWANQFDHDHSPNLKIRVVTGYTEKAVIRGGFLDPGMDMLTKPFALDAFGSKVRMMIKREF